MARRVARWESKWGPAPAAAFFASGIVLGELSCEVNVEDRRRLLVLRSYRDRIERSLLVEALDEEARELGYVVWPQNGRWGDPGWGRLIRARRRALEVERLNVNPIPGAE